MSDRFANLGASMADAIAHRGPDGEGVWLERGLGVLLAHRRLAIIDISPQGHQPMVSASGRYVLAFNGEIYNFSELRRQVEAGTDAAPAWRGHSDTEVLLAACERWGIEGAIERANGMFALAIVDLQSRCLVLARDRMGEKPLYYGWQGQSFLFASELKSFARHPDFERRLEPRALPLYLRFGYVPSPWSIYSGVRKLPPGHLLQLPLQAVRGAEQLMQYWTVPMPRADGSIAAVSAIDQLDALLREAVAARLHSDVPLGAFLSGGVDSSAIVALMQAQMNRPVHTYSIGFREQSHDESGHARRVAAALGTDHTELHVTASDALAVVPALAQIYDEPFADSSQIPTHLLSKLTREHVTVALSGDGGDELFGGYERYLRGMTLQVAYRVVPYALRAAAGRMLQFAARPGWDALLRRGPRHFAVLASAERLFKLSEVLSLRDHRAMYKRLASQWPDPSLITSVPEEATVLEDEAILASAPCPSSWMMYIDQLTYLPDDILAKVDRASMAVALEVRVPFLDPRVVQFAARLPIELKLRNGTGKWLLRQVVHRYLDQRLFDRPKQGFAVPLASWLRGPLRPWAEDLLSSDALRRSGLLELGPIRDAWNDHIGGRRNHHHALWTVLMFQAWYRREMVSS